MARNNRKLVNKVKLFTGLAEVDEEKTKAAGKTRINVPCIDELNTWLAEHPEANLVDMKFSTFEFSGNDAAAHYSVLVHYKTRS